jgi:hypothetical protein
MHVERNSTRLCNSSQHIQTKHWQHKLRFPTTPERQRTSSLPPWPLNLNERRTQQGSSLQPHPKLRSLSFSGMEEVPSESTTIATPSGSAKTAFDSFLSARGNETFRISDHANERRISMNGEKQRARLPSAGTVSTSSGPSPGSSSSFLSAVHLKMPMSTSTTTSTRRLKRAQSECSRPSSALSAATATNTTTAIASGRKNRKISDTGSGLMHDTILLLRKTSLHKKGQTGLVKTRVQVQELDTKEDMYMTMGNNTRQAGTASPISNIPFKGASESSSSSKGRRRSGSSTRSGRNVLSRQQQTKFVIDEQDSVYSNVSLSFFPSFYSFRRARALHFKMVATSCQRPKRHKSYMHNCMHWNFMQLEHGTIHVTMISRAVFKLRDYSSTEATLVPIPRLPLPYFPISPLVPCRGIRARTSLMKD